MRTRPNKRFTEDEAAFYTVEIAEGLGYLHSLNFLNRDLIKPEKFVCQSAAAGRTAAGEAFSFV